MKRTTCFAAAVMIFAMLLSGCGGAGEGDPPTAEALFSAPYTSHGTDAAGEEPVILWIRMEDTTQVGFTLSGEQAAFARELFYDHEQERLSSPAEDGGSVRLQIGGDVLAASLAEFSRLDGVRNNEPVRICLNEEECLRLRAIIAAHVMDLSKVP